MGIFLDRKKKLLRRPEFEDNFSLIEYLDEDKVFLFDEPAMGAFIVCQPSSGHNDELRNSLENFYKTEWGDDTFIQMQLVSMPDIEDVLYGYDMVRGNRFMGPDQPRVDVLADSIRDFYRQGTYENINDNGYRFKNFEFWVTIKIQLEDALPSEKELKLFKKQVRTTMSFLNGFSPQLADDKMYKRRMSVLLNMYGSGDWKGKANHEDKCFIDRKLSGLLLDEGKAVDWDKAGVTIYDQDLKPCQYIKSATVKSMPETLHYGHMINFLGDWATGRELLDEHFLLTLNIHQPNQRKAMEDFDSRRKVIINQARGAVVQYLDKLKFQKNDFDMCKRELDQSGSTLLNYHMQMLFFTRDEDSANEFMDKVQGMYSKMNIVLKPDNYFTLPFVLAGLPFGLDKSYLDGCYRFQQATSKAMPFLTPHIASWKGNTMNPTILLGTRFGQVVGLDPFVTDSNYNIYWSGISGGGKSFSVGFLVNALLGRGTYVQRDRNRTEKFNDGTQVFMIDVGYSYAGIAEQYDDAQFLTFGRDLKVSLNPFASINAKNGIEGKDGEVNLIHSILLTMGAPDGKVTNLQRNLLYKVIINVWNAKGRDATVTDVAEMCKKHDVSAMREFGLQLEPFTEGNLYGDFFSNKYPPVNFSGRLIVCELEELKSDKLLQCVVLMSLVMSIQRKMFLKHLEDDTRRSALVLDESWEFLKGDDGSGNASMGFVASFIETGWRRFRKYGALGALCTQGVTDAFQTPAGRAIIDNSAWKFFMKQNPDVVDRLKDEKMFSGSPGDFNLLKSVHTLTPKPHLTDEAYSELFINHGTMSQVCRLYTDRKFQLILTTKDTEKNRRSELMNTGLSFNQAIDQMIKEEQNNRVI
ncbi:MAG: TraC family protein [Alteromonadaceae bacterium]|nr:TraC family protein [Alteromonadaceae bacterium]